MQKSKNILLEFKCISNLLKRYLNQHTKMGEYEGLTGVRIAIIGFIGEKSLERDVFQKDIEAEFEIRRSTATVMLKQLEKDGYITRISVVQDARLKKIVLTPLAEEICENVAGSIGELALMMLEGLTVQEKDFLFSVMEKIKNNLKEK